MTARRAGGFAYIAAIVFLVVLAGFALAVLRLSDTQQITVSQAILGSRASLAARTGLELAFYQLKTPGTECKNVPTWPDLKTATGFVVRLDCTMQTYSEGVTENGTPVSKTIFELKATACNGSTCPGTNSDLANPDYVERVRTASICVPSAGSECY